MVTGDGRFVVAIVRGDDDLNETKLVNAIKATGGLRPAQVEEILARGMQAGYGSPIGAARRGRRRRRAGRAAPEPRRRRQQARLPPAEHERRRATTRPTSSPTSRNVREGDACPNCGGPVILRNGIEIGNIFKLGHEVHEGAGRRVPGRGRRAPPDRHGLVRHRPRAQRRLHRRGPPRREGHRVAGRGRAVPGAPRRPRREQEPRGHRDRRAAARAGGRRRPGHEILYDDRDESPGRQVRRRGPAGHALDPHREPALARGRRRSRSRTARPARRPSGRSRTSRPSWRVARRRRSDPGRVRRGATDARPARPRGRPVRAPRGRGRRLARGDRARLARAAQAPPPGRRRERRGRARSARSGSTSPTTG